ncbi:amidase chyE [Colletotrichum spaethianum]|uniref:Amidase chyE n=1 Tax=Colletotrichum spaethianum TaxID=700344 RepID=A0AA37UPS0_9PEZI|nr:amidase chyE [Colletotrichum spaethianum]GKT47552.1 amidase chyE [Colletotrichum spaethianum]
MCGITASIALPRAAVVNQHVNGYINGHSNGNVNGHVSGNIACENYSHNDAPAAGHTNGSTLEKLRNQLHDSLRRIEHRGPDESGIWVSREGSVGLGHCRLSINDLSPSGSQPLTSDDGQIHAIVNGEIYDHDRLRKLCATEHNYNFQGESDSELVLALYKIYGAPAFFEHLRGEFAFVLYDSRPGSKRIIACRDRFGIKPLFWTKIQGRLLLAAENKAFLAMGWEPEWDVPAMIDGGWMMDDRTIFKGVKKILPGHWMEVTDDRGIELHKYWDAEYEDKTKVETRTIEEMVLGVRERLVESIRLRLRADVPVGIYLSGGIDSSAVAGIVTELARKNHVKIGNETATQVTCFSVRFPQETGYDESSIADRTAKWLGVETIKKDVTEESLANDFADTAFHCEHHHFDLNSVAKFALSTLPHEHGVKVVLTGEGSDEHFAGYPYFPCEFLREPDLSQPDSLLARNHKLRKEMQQAASTEMNAIWRAIGADVYESTADSANLLADVNGNTMPQNLLSWHPSMGLFAPWVHDRYKFKLDCRRTVMAAHSTDVRDKMRERWHPLHTAQYMWNKSSLANVLLSCLGDRTEMAHSVEARTPFLDHHLTDYVNALPPSVKLAYAVPEENGAGEGGKDDVLWKSAGSALRSMTEKWILREAARPYITEELYLRKKHPFLAPTKWPRDGPLHCMFRSLLTRSAVDALGFVDHAVVEDALERAFGDAADAKSFRVLCYVGSWVTLAQRFGVKKASVGDWA